MLRSLIPVLACPDCLAPLSLKKDDQYSPYSITTGTLACTSCDSQFQIDRGIPRLMPREMLDAQKEEIAARDAQVKQYDTNHFLNIFGRFEIPMTLSRLGPLMDDRVLEAGCGTGRMTGKLARKVKDVTAVDFSFDSLLANQAKLRAAGIKNVNLVQADICSLPFVTDTFDRAISCQVLEHVPDNATKCLAVASISDVTKIGGRVVISAYKHSPLMGKKEGRHNGGIPFFRFTRYEFHHLLSTGFKVKSVSGALVYLYLAQCEKKMP